MPFLLAHQGGWDEMLLVATPIAVLALVLWFANRRAARLQEARDEGDDDAARSTATAPAEGEADLDGTGA